MKTSVTEFIKKAKLVKKDDRYTVYDLAMQDLVVSMTVLHRDKATTGHSHDTEEIYLFVGGKGEIQLVDEKEGIAGGDIVLIPQKAFHRVFNTGNGDLTFLCLFRKYPGRGK